MTISMRKASGVGLLVAMLFAAWCAISFVSPAYAAQAGSYQVGAAVGIADTAASNTAATEGGTAATTVEKHANGWELDGDVWHYWKNNEMVRGKWLSTKTAPDIEQAAEGKQRYWVDNDGNLAVNRLVNPDSELDEGAGYWAFATKGAYIAKGKTIVGKKIYLANRRGKLATGDENGILVTKRYDADGQRHRYLIDKKAHAVITDRVVKVKGWGKAYSFPETGYLACGITPIDSKHVLLATDEGKLLQRKGWLVTGKFTKGVKERYWMGRSTANKKVYAARIGLFKIQGNKYYGEAETGYVFRNGYKEAKGSYYSADNDGVMVKNGVITRMVNMAQGYSSPSQYLILVDTDDTKFIVFEGSQGNWNVKFIWDCSTGAPWTPTPSGVWQVGIKGYSFGHGYTCYYYTQFNGDYLIHTRIYQEGTHILMDDAMNTRVSQGCVRLYDEDAYWVYTNVPQGTTVVTFE